MCAFPCARVLRIRLPGPAPATRLCRNMAVCQFSPGLRKSNRCPLKMPWLASTASTDQATHLRYLKTFGNPPSLHRARCEAESTMSTSAACPSGLASSPPYTAQSECPPLARLSCVWVLLPGDLVRVWQPSTLLMRQRGSNGSRSINLRPRMDALSSRYRHVLTPLFNGTLKVEMGWKPRIEP
jgi:hypothetical protein